MEDAHDKVVSSSRNNNNSSCSDIMENFAKIELLGENRKMEDAKIVITIEDENTNLTHPEKEKQIKPLVNETPTTSNNNNSCSDNNNNSCSKIITAFFQGVARRVGEMTVDFIISLF